MGIKAKKKSLMIVYSWKCHTNYTLQSTFFFSSIGMKANHIKTKPHKLKVVRDHIRCKLTNVKNLILYLVRKKKNHPSTNVISKKKATRMILLKEDEYTWSLEIKDVE